MRLVVFFRCPVDFLVLAFWAGYARLQGVARILFIRHLKLPLGVWFWFEIEGQSIIVTVDYSKHRQMCLKLRNLGCAGTDARVAIGKEPDEN